MFSTVQKPTTERPARRKIKEWAEIKVDEFIHLIMPGKVQVQGFQTEGYK